MGDPSSRKCAALRRLRNQLKKKRESLADHFEFKMYILFHFKDKKKKCAVFEVAQVMPVMTNNYEESILQGAREEEYSFESSQKLLEKDVVQLHAPRWQSMRRVNQFQTKAGWQDFYITIVNISQHHAILDMDVIGCTTDVDFFLWPRNDIDKIDCHLFSRWKGDSSPYRPIKMEFTFSHHEYEKQLIHLLSCKDKTGLIINNPEQSLFLFIDKAQLQTSKSKVVMFNLASICLFLPQDQLTHWGPGTTEDIISPYLT